MGLMVNGKWHDRWYDTKASNGRFVRTEPQFRNWITPEGAAGPTGRSGFIAKPGRYHLYVSLACPWAHRTLVFRKLKGLEDAISISITHWFMGADGWTFQSGPGVAPDPIYGAVNLHQIYSAVAPDYSGRVTVPVLFDKESKEIVSNESSEIIRMMNSAFDGVGALPGDYYPAELRDQIDSINAEIYNHINNGVYKAGFATTQEAYEEAVWQLFAALDRIEARLASQRYLCGERITEADWRLFTTLVRFDSVYFGHFKCNWRRIVDYPNIWEYARELYQKPGIRETVNFDHIKRHYFQSHESINPSRVVPVGPALDFDQPHTRARLRAPA